MLRRDWASANWKRSNGKLVYVMKMSMGGCEQLTNSPLGLAPTYPPNKSSECTKVMETDLGSAIHKFTPS